MNNKAITTLEFHKIKDELMSCTQSGLGKRLVERMEPLDDSKAIEHAMLETTEARKLLDQGSHVPLAGLADVTELLGKVERGGVLQPTELLQVADLLRGAARLRRYMEPKASMAPLLASYSKSITDLTEVEETILACIEGSVVSSSASIALKRIRSQIGILEDRIQRKLNELLSSAYRQYVQDSFISMKEGRFVIPIRSAYKHKVDGMIVSSSGSGSTVFVEPAAVRKLTNELQVLRAQEDAEVYQILSMLTGEISVRLPSIKLSVETMAAFDFALAKGRYSRSMDGIAPRLNRKRTVNLFSARHPLLGKKAVPLDIWIGATYRTLVITGPNTGGKTVALKTLGLLTLMAQAGLHIPAAQGSELSIFSEVLVDIGDGQSIEHSLSTFSSHMGNISGIVDRATPACLVLMDEIGTGTDPQEGAALAASILLELYEAGAVTVATTHYGDIKRFADEQPGFQNGMMDFDSETLRPLYRLIIGQAGSSNGLWIAERLGLKPRVLERARLYLHRTDAQMTPGAKRDSLAARPEASNPESDAPEEKRPLKLGDRVFVHTVQHSGVVSELPDEKGMMTVMVMREPIRVNHRRVTFERPMEELYPDHESYDLNIVIMSKQDRKLNKRMGKRHVPGAVRIIKPGIE